ncbi:MAG: tail assembly protein [Gammaproteobacteria bacterium]
MRMLVANWPEIEQHMAQYHYQVIVGGNELALIDEPQSLHYPAGENEDIRIIPVVGGSGGGGFWQALAGVALVGLSFVTGGIFSTVLLGLGASLALGGVAQMIAPTPTLNMGPDSEADPRKSYSFSGIQNTARQGVPVPVVYGRMLIGSIMISQGINTDKVKK